MKLASGRRMRALREKIALRLVPKLRDAEHWIVAQLVIGVLWSLRRLPVDRAIGFSAWLFCRIGPRLGRHRHALANLRAAYPEKSEAEIEAIAMGMWDHLGRFVAEYVFLDSLFDYNADDPARGRIELVGEESFFRMAAERGTPHIIFTGHIGNFELLPIAAALHGTEVASLFRPPNNPYIARNILSTRRKHMGDLVASNAGAAFTLSAILSRGGNVGMLVDQKFSNGVPTTFFGRQCDSNPILAMLARRFECAVYPVRCVRLPGNRYRIFAEDRLELARNADGDIDIAAATQQLNDTVERWVREYPSQWMWLHKRWSPTRPGGHPPLPADRAPAAQGESRPA